MNPNPSLIYTGMTLSGGGVNDGTIISSYVSGSGGVGTYNITSSGSVLSWNTFSQSTGANQPTFDLYSVNFNRTNSQHLTNSNLSFNIDTNGGFTAIAYVNFTGTASTYERIFDFGNGQSNNNLLINRQVGNIYIFAVFEGATQTLAFSGGTINQNEWHTISIVYTKNSTTPYKMYKNKQPLNLTFAVGSQSTTISDRTLTSNYIGKSNWTTDPYTNGSIRGFLVYDRALSDIELNTATDALLNFNQNYSTTNLVVNLQINLPLYTNMYFNKGTSGTFISSSTSNVIYTVNNSQSLTSTSILGKPFADPSFSTGSISGTTLTATGSPSGLYQGVNLVASGLSANTFLSSGSTNGGAGTYSLITYQNNTPTTGGNLTSMSYSDDLINWTSISTNPFTTSINDIYWDGVYFIAVGSGGAVISSSTDLSTWTTVSSPPFTTGNNIFSNGIIWVAVGSGSNTIAYSTNGTSWTSVSGSTSIFSTSGNALTWTGKRWVAGGNGTNIGYSNDGQTWYFVNTGQFSTQTNCINANSSVGAVVVDSQIIIDVNGNGLSDNLEFVSDRYYNSEYNAFSVTIKSRQV